MAQYLGIVDIIWRGQNIPVTKGSKIRPGGIRNNVVTLSRSAGRAEEFQPTEVKAKTHLRNGQSYLGLLDRREGELQVICDTGQTFVIRDAFLSGDIPDLTGGEGGEIELTWSGSAAEEILA